MDDLRTTLADLRRLHEAATKGPWNADHDEEAFASYVTGRGLPNIAQVSYTVVGGLTERQQQTTADLIAAMRNALPALLEIADAAVGVDDFMAKYDMSQIQLGPGLKAVLDSLRFALDAANTRGGENDG